MTRGLTQDWEGDFCLHRGQRARQGTWMGVEKGRKGLGKGRWKKRGVSEWEGRKRGAG